MIVLKVIFLDIDGVLNCYSTDIYTKSGTQFIEDKYIERLKSIIDATDTKVVLSSDWRYSRDLPELKDNEFFELLDKLAEFGIGFYGFTPYGGWDSTRGDEIDAWLKEHPEAENFVILDDRCDMEPHKEKLVRTEPVLGLTTKNVECAIHILNN